MSVLIPDNSRGLLYEAVVLALCFSLPSHVILLSTGKPAVWPAVIPLPILLAMPWQLSAAVSLTSPSQVWWSSCRLGLGECAPLSFLSPQGLRREGHTGCYELSQFFILSWKCSEGSQIHLESWRRGCSWVLSLGSHPGTPWWLRTETHPWRSSK